ILGLGYSRIGVRGPELKGAPPEVLAGQVLTLSATDLFTTLETSAQGGTQVDIQIGTFKRTVKVQEDRVVANPGVTPPELEAAHHFVGVTTDAAGPPNAGSLVSLTADPTNNQFSGSIREITDPGAPIQSQGSLWVEPMAQYDNTLDPHGGAHLVYA